MKTKLLAQICKVPGIPGDEGKIRDLITKEIKSHVDEIRTDNMGNLIAFKKGKSSKKCLMTAAHMDEIGFLVRHIDKSGFLKITTVGGFDPKTLVGQRVIVHGKKDIIGIFGTPAAHLQTPEQKKQAPKIENLYIDLGLPEKDVKKIVSIGDSVSRQNDLIEIGNCVTSKSLDNRLSVFIQIEAIRKAKKPAYDTYYVFTVQEEVGLRGAATSSRQIDPDFAICLDGTIANDLPGQSDDKHCTKLGDGTAIKIIDRGVICDRRMVAFMRDIAEKKKIKYQEEILTAGGTDTAMMQRAGTKGAISGAISTPTRYMHSYVETAHKKDIEGSIDLLAACIEGLDKIKGV